VLTKFDIYVFIVSKINMKYAVFYAKIKETIRLQSSLINVMTAISQY
jgi:hypothetical protein